MPLLIQRGHTTLLIDSRDHGAQGRLPIRINHLESGPEVTEYLAENTARLRHQKLDSILMTELTELQLLVGRTLGQNNNRVVLQILARQSFGWRQCQHWHPENK